MNEMVRTYLKNIPEFILNSFLPQNFFFPLLPKPLCIFVAPCMFVQNSAKGNFIGWISKHLLKLASIIKQPKTPGSHSSFLTGEEIVY